MDNNASLRAPTIRDARHHTNEHRNERDFRSADWVGSSQGRQPGYPRQAGQGRGRAGDVRDDAFQDHATL